MSGFTIMLNAQERNSGLLPSVIPWDVVQKHEAQCLENHEQTLTRLNERGGLDPIELYYVLRDERWPGTKKMVSIGHAVHYIKARIELYEAERTTGIETK